MDTALVILLILIGSTLGAWAAGWVVFPYGILILSVALVARVLVLRLKARP